MYLKVKVEYRESVHVISAFGLIIEELLLYVKGCIKDLLLVASSIGNESKRNSSEIRPKCIPIHLRF